MLSVFLAVFLGWYLIIFSLYILTRYAQFEVIAKESVTNPFANFFSALLAIILGLFLVISHSLWVADWRLIITIIGYLALVKGLLRLFFPKVIIKMTVFWLKHKLFSIVTSIILLLVGVYLLYSVYI